MKPKPAPTRHTMPLRHVLLLFLTLGPTLACRVAGEENAAAAVTPPAPAPLTLEQFGGHAYYKRFDGHLTYTPGSAIEDPAILRGTGLPEGAPCTLITWTGEGEPFTAEDRGKRFCGLFVHRNPGEPDPEHPDLYYPNIDGSRYATVVQVLDGRNILVDFEFNGRSLAAPRTIAGQKGYIFFDNSDAWQQLLTEYRRPENEQTEIRLREHRQDGLLHATYVIPEHRSIMLPNKPLTLWTGTAGKARVKLGVEDYFQWDRVRGEPRYRQENVLFRNNAYDHDIVIHNVVWTPPHRAIPEANTFTRNFFGSPAVIGACTRILAIVGNTALDEQREIAAGAGLTDEHIRCMGVGFVYSGGIYDGEGVAEDIADYQYILLKDFEHNGAGLIDLKANSGAGNFLVIENVRTDYLVETDWQPPAVLVDGRFTADKSGLHPEIVARDYYPEDVFEITSSHSFYQVDNTFHIHGWSNRANIIQIERFAFTIGSGTAWSNIYEHVHSEGKPMFDWRVAPGANASHMRTGRKHMIIQRIPRAGGRYMLGRDYTVDFTMPVRSVKAVSPNVVRGFINWSVVLGKALPSSLRLTADTPLIDPATDVPVHAKPIQLQAGDQFRIVGYGDELYSVLNNDRGPYSQFNTEYNGRETYNYSRHTLDKPLPANLPLAFDIEMVTSTSEHLLDGAVRPAWLIYKSNVGWNSTVTTKFGDEPILRSNPLGHLSYNHRQFALWAKNFQHNGFYRESSNQDASAFQIQDPDTGETITVNRLARYSTGYTFIDSSGFQGQFGGAVHDVVRRDKIRRSLGAQRADAEVAKIRLYNSAKINLPRIPGSENLIEVHETAEHAPDMPARCRALLDSLP